ncbi:MAG: DUF1846 domain-containing protein [Bacilli bacterium]|nr:DUF1846 domain-containing protein [Bacilli bacterium]MDD4607779.1 DUF1846 domain-containing protein [Bacilli bacterium]
MKKGFDNEKYVKLQSEQIQKRMKMFDKLYLEFGGKLVDDHHAVRVLPGFELNSKIRCLEELKDDAEVIFCINANDIEKNKIRADYGTTYDTEILRLIDLLKALEIEVNSVVITLYKGQMGADSFRKKLERRNIKTYIHTATKGYPTDIDVIVSEEGYGANPYIETTKPLVVVTAPGPSSGKLATCLSQLYHEHKRGVKAGYAKFETFPVWDLPLKHPVNMAYEAATADLKDVNMIDSFHLEHYNISAVSYNRDLKVFPILKTILSRITKDEIYHSPTDMGVNMIGNCIIDDKTIQTAACDEIIRRYYRAMCDYKIGTIDEETPQKVKVLMNELGVSDENRKVIKAALKKKELVNRHVLSLKLPNGKIITGKQTDLLSPASSLILNAIKELTKIPDEVYLLSPSILEPILKTKPKSDNPQNYLLNLQEVIIALSICSATNPIIEKALNNLSKLHKCEAHATYIVQNGDLNILRNLEINLTCEPEFYSNNLYNE